MSAIECNLCTSIVGTTKWVAVSIPELQISTGNVSPSTRALLILKF